MTQPTTSRPDDPPPASNRRPFRDVALASGLLAAEDVDAAEALARVRALGDAAFSAVDGQRRFDALTAAVLVEQGKLTPFQAREMRAGRTRFRLGQYTVIDEVGKGGMGQVFKAEHALMGRQVAVKVLPRSKATPESEAAFRREMRILGRLDHENLVRAFDAGYDAMVYYLVTELVPGSDLRRLIRKHGPIDEIAAASVFSQVARALAFAHAQGLVHRDVKPGNILVMDDGRAKLLDLGLAGSTLQAEEVRLGRVVGTMDYIAPEQIRTPDDVGPAADIYALGCSMYFALTGEVPFPGGTRKDKMRRHLTETPPPIEHVAPHLSRPLCQVIASMMAKSVDDRIGSADEVIRRLAPWTPEKPVPITRPAEDTADRASAGASGPVLDVERLPPRVEAPPLLETPREHGRRAARRDDDLRSLFFESVGEVASSRLVARAATVFLPAAFVGLALTAFLTVIRAGDRRGFRELFGAVTPAACGGVAFLLLATVLAVVGVGRRRR